MAIRKKNPLKGLFTVTAKGREYHYAWRGGPRIEAEYGTTEFLEEFLAARSPETNLDRSRFGAWVGLYRASDDYEKLSASTKKNWAPKLDVIKAHFGKLPIRLFDRPAIRKDIRHWRDKWVSTPRTADYGKQVLSRVLAFAVAEGALQSNPCDGIPNLYRNNRSDIIWTDDDLERLCKVASPEIASAARLAALTGMRRGDLLRLPWSRVGELAIEIKTAKSGGRRTAIIPITKTLRELLAAIPKRATTVLTNTDGVPWKSGFSASWNKAVRRAGLDLHFHDLRGTAATNYYRARLTLREIADIMGWSEDKVERRIDRYVRREEILRDRISRIERAENENRKTDSKTSTAR